MAEKELRRQKEALDRRTTYLEAQKQKKEVGEWFIFILRFLLLVCIYFCCCSLFFDPEVVVFIPRVCGNLIPIDTVYLFLFTDETDDVVFPS